MPNSTMPIDRCNNEIKWYTKRGYRPKNVQAWLDFVSPPLHIRPEAHIRDAERHTWLTKWSKYFYSFSLNRNQCLSHVMQDLIITVWRNSLLECLINFGKFSLCLFINRAQWLNHAALNRDIYQNNHSQHIHPLTRLRTPYFWELSTFFSVCSNCQIASSRRRL